MKHFLTSGILLTLVVVPWLNGCQPQDSGQRPATRLIAMVDGKRLAYELEAKLTIDAQKDFDEDGTLDALVTASSGGTAMPDEHLFISVADGRFATAPIGLQDFTVVEEGAHFLVKDESDVATEFWGFDGRKAIKVRSSAHAKLSVFTHMKVRDTSPLDHAETLIADLGPNGKPSPLWGY